MRRTLVSLLLLVACADRDSTVSSSVAICELPEPGSVCSAPATPITATVDEASAPDVVAGTTYEITGPSRGYVIFTPPATGTYTMYFGHGKPLRVCDETATCEAPHVAGCGPFARAAQYTLQVGEPYEIEVKTPFRLHIVAPAAPPTGVKLAPAVLYAAGTTPYYVETGDLDADGILDLAVSTPDDAGGMTTVDILRGAAGGSFTMIDQIATSAPGETVVGDATGDGVVDIVGVAADGQGPLPAFLLTGPDFMRSTWATGIDYWPDLAAADFDEDGTRDLVAAYAGGFELRTLPGFAVVDDEAFDARHVTTGDFDGDGHADVAVASVTGELRIYAGDGTGEVTLLDDVTFADAIVKNIFAADLDGDARADLVVAFSTGDSVVIAGTPTGFGSQVTVAATGSGIGAGDFDHDGVLDLAFSEGDHITIALATSGGFAPAATLAVPNGGGRDLVVADFNADGFADIAATTFGAVAIYLSVP